MKFTPRTVSLEIYLLGSFQVKVNGVPIDKQQWKRRSSANLVKLLALQPNHQMHREQIIELFWTEQDIETSVNNLNKAIHSVRRTLEPNLSKATDSKFIITQKHQVQLYCPDDNLFVDAKEFERLASKSIKTENIADCEISIELYKGDLLFEDLYEDWIVARREYLRILYRKLVTKTASIYSGQGRHDRGIELLKNLSLIDPTDERVHQELMRLYAMTGSKYQALKQYEICRKTLFEIGLEPETETVEIKSQIQTGNVQPVEFKITNTFDDHSKNFLPLADVLPNQVYYSQPRIKQLTFLQGVIQSAKFAPDGYNIIFSAAWEGNELELYKIHKQSPEFSPVGLKNTNVFDISKNDEIALALNRKFLRGYTSVCTLAHQHISGGTPRELLENLQWADWKPDKNFSAGSSYKDCFLVVRESNGRNRLEYPVGNVLYETGGWISHPQFSPDGVNIAFIDHPTLADDSGTISVVNLDGTKKTLTDVWISAQGLVWKSIDEIWFTATEEGNARAIHAVNLEGQKRLVYRGIGSITIHDLSKDGAALITVNKTRIKILAKGSGEVKERDLSWHDWSLVRDLSSDGKTILFTEAGESGGAMYTVYIRSTDGSPALRLGNGSALALSPDGKYALTRLLTTPPQLALLPVGAGETKLLKPVKSDSYFYQPWACWFPSGKKILFAANEADRGTKLYIQGLDGEPVCITPDMEGVELSTPHSISSDGKFIAFTNPQQEVCLYSIENAEILLLSELEPNQLPVAWSADSKSIYIRKRGQVPAVIYRHEIGTGKKEQLLELMPEDRAGVFEILRILLTTDATSYAYSYTRELSDLFVIENLQ